MDGLTLPQLDSPKLRRSRDGAMWRAAVTATESGQWVGWNRVEVEGEAVPPASSTPAEETASLCRGLALYLELLPVEERVRHSARVARVLDAVHANTDLRPFSSLALIPDNDRDSLWQAVLRILVSRDRQGSDPGAWPGYVAFLPAPTRARWREQLASLDISEELRGQLERVLTSDAPPATASAAAAVAPKAGSEDAAWPSRLAASAPAPGREVKEERESGAAASEGAGGGRTAVLVAGRDLPMPTGVPQVSAPKAEEKPSSGAPGRTISMRSLAHLTGADAARAAEAARAAAERRSDSGPKKLVAEPIVGPGAGAPRGAKTTDELPPIEALGARASQIAVESAEMSAVGGAGMELVGGYAGRPLPAVARVLLFATGLIVVVSAVRLALRFLLGLRREGRVRLEEGRVVVESAHFMLGKQMRHVRRTFGPEGLLSVAREVRYPALYLYVGMFALTFGALTGTIAYLDGTLAGFEDWIRTGLLLILGGLVVDFLFAVVAVTRPGRTTLSLTFAPRTTVRILGVDQSRADSFLDLIARRAYGA